MGWCSTGLNPAGPGFHDARESERISKLSGKLVEIVHSDDTHGIASKHDIGHLDFFLNEGSNQPACKKSKSEYCGHFLAAESYAEAILKPGSFLGVRCQSWANFQKGQCFKEHATIGTIPPVGDNFTNGRYYMRTSATGPPHALGETGIDFKNKPTKSDQTGFFQSMWIKIKEFFGWISCQLWVF